MVYCTVVTVFPGELRSAAAGGRLLRYLSQVSTALWTCNTSTFNTYSTLCSQHSTYTLCCQHPVHTLCSHNVFISTTSIFPLSFFPSFSHMYTRTSQETKRVRQAEPERVRQAEPERERQAEPERVGVNARERLHIVDPHRSSQQDRRTPH